MNPLKFNLDIKEDSYETCDLMQGYDYNMSFIMTDNYTNLDLTGVIIQIQMQKADETFIIQTEKITVVGNVINVEIDKDLTREFGKGKLQIVLVKNGKTFGSWVIKCNIKASAINDNDGQSENKVTITETLTNKVTEANNAKIELDKSIVNGDTVKMRVDIDKNIVDIKNNSSQLAEITTIILDRLNVEIDDKDSLERTINKIPNNGVIILNRDITLNSQVIIDKSFVLDGRDFKIICGVNGLHDWIKCNGVNANVEFKNCNFDDNKKGRVIVTCENLDNIKFINCDFTGYTKDYGYYKTDGLVRLDSGTKNAYFDNCVFHDSGYEYGHETNDLNRCISFNYTDIERGTVKNCIFRRVNQAIVSVNKKLTIENCIFDEVNDNSIYTSGDILTVDNCLFTSQNDEPVVTGCRVNNIKNNTFVNFTNKAIALTHASMDIVNIEGNTFTNNNAYGQALSFRPNMNLTKLNFNSNVIKCSTLLYTNAYPIITTGEVQLFNCNDNYMETNQPINSTVVQTNGVITNFKNNIVKQINNTSGIFAIKNGGSAIKINCKDNNVTGCRIPINKGNQGNIIEPNAPYITNDSMDMLFCSVKPNYILDKGTVIFNTNFNTELDVKSWTSNGTEWIPNYTERPFKHNTSNTPVGWSAPSFVGQLWIGSADAVWIAIKTGGQTSEFWKKLID